MTPRSTGPWRVFLSHTSDLAPFVDAAKEAVTRAGHLPVDMKYFAADDRPPSEVCVAAVESSDVYVLVAGARYGSPVRDRPDVSYTELEFLTAAKAKIPRLAFLQDVTADPPQQSFRDRVTDSDLTAATFTNPPALETRLYQALVQLERRRIPPVWSVPPLRGTEVARPSLADALVAAVLAPEAGSVGVTTGLVGAGGFGKTTLARMVAHRVRDRFLDGVVWVTVGEDTTGPDLAALITSAARLFDPTAPEVTDSLAAGALLGRALADRQVLLVLDDVWTVDQIEPFLIGGDQAVRLFTTRQRDVLPGVTVRVQVDQMTADEARRMLGDGPPAELIEEVLSATGRWPVLLALINGAMRDGVEAGGDAERELVEILSAMRADGITVLDVGNEGARSHAVARTLEASLRRLTPAERSRFLDLSVFGEDVTIPGNVVYRLWAHTGGWSAFRSRRFLNRLYKLSLLAGYHRDPDEAQLHDVVRAYSRQRTADRRAELDAAIVDAHRSLSPAGWAGLPDLENYLWTWLPTHLWAAGLRDELKALLGDPAWLLGKLRNVGAAALEADLTLAAHDDLAAVVRQNAHVLAPTDSPRWLAATFASRLPLDKEQDQLREGLRRTSGNPFLRPVEPLPDRPHPALVRVLPGLADPTVLAASPDDRWIAYVADDNTIRLRDPITGDTRATMKGFRSDVRALAIAPAGEWLVASCVDGTVSIWETRTGQLRHQLRADLGEVRALAVGPGGTWVAAYGLRARVVQVWDTRTGLPTMRLSCASFRDDIPRDLLRTDRKKAFAQTLFGGSLIADPRGRWIALVARSNDSGVKQELHVWELVAGRARRLDAMARLSAVAITVEPGGAWLATADADGSLRIWDPGEWTQRVLSPSGGASGHRIALAASPDGRWLAAARGGQFVTVIDVATGEAVAGFAHRGNDPALEFGPQGDWFAASAGDIVTIRNTHDWAERTELMGHGGAVSGLVVSGNGRFVASAAAGRAVRVWNPAAVATGVRTEAHTDAVTAIAVSPDASMIASQSADGTVRVWNPEEGNCVQLLDLSQISEPINLARGWLSIFDAEGRAGTDSAGRSDESFRIREPGSSDYLRVSGSCRWEAFPTLYGLSAVSGFAHAAVMETYPVTGEGRGEGSGRFQRIGDNWANLLALVPAPSGQWWVVTLGSDQRVRLWDPRSGQQHIALEGEVQALPNFPEKAIAVDGAGRWLAVGDARAAVHVWNPIDGGRRHTLIGHRGSVTDLAATPDGSLCSVGDDCVLRVWDPIAGKPLAAIRVEHPLSHVVATRNRIVAVGSRFLYFFELVGR